MSDSKILFAGPTGVGKSTAIKAISDISPLTTDEAAIDNSGDKNRETTVKMDYGMLKLGTGDRLHLYGAPGQVRYSLVRETLDEGCIGLLLLVNNAGSDPINEMFQYMEPHKKLIDKGALAVGITRHGDQPTPTTDDYHRVLKEKKLNVPVFSVDPDNKHEVIMLIQALLFNLDAGVN